MFKSIIITGANGFIGSALVDFFANKDYQIKALVRNPEVKAKENIHYFKYELGKSLEDESLFKNANYLIHCAFERFDQQNNSDFINEKGTKDLIELSRKYSVKMVFLSSFSAHSEAESHYGKNKFFLESFFDQQKDIIVKPGLVLGKGGLFSTIYNYIKKASIIPLIGGGHQPVQTIYINDLCKTIESVLIKNLNGTYWVAEPTACSMKKFYTLIAAAQRKKILFIPLPQKPLLYLTKIIETLGLKLPVNSENILGLKNLRSHDTLNDLKILDITLLNARESIELISNSDQR